MNQQTPDALLGFIRSAETTRGYEDYYRGARVAPPKPVTQMTVNEVRAWQNHAIQAGSKSSAVGGYQIISKTLGTLVNDLGLTGDEMFDGPMQDRLGTELLRRRGYDKWSRGELPDGAFLDNLAMEWASLPRATGPKKGQSHYAGDGLNRNTRNLSQSIEALSQVRSGANLAVYTKNSSGTEEAMYRRNIVDPTTNYTGADVTDVAPITPYLTQDDEQKAADATGYKPGEFAKSLISLGPVLGFAVSAQEEGSLANLGMTAINEEWVSNNVARQFGREDFVNDPVFKKNGFSEEQWKEITTGIPDEYRGEFVDAVSMEHAKAIAARTHEAVKRDQKLGQAGLAGIGLRFGAALADPVAIALSAATEGVAAPYIYGAKVSRLGRFLRAGMLASTTNVGLDAYLVSQDPAGSWSSLAYSAAAGFILGGSSGAMRRSEVDHELMTPVAKILAQVDGAPVMRPLGLKPDETLPTPDGSLGAARATPLDETLLMAERVYKAAEDESTSALGRWRIDMVGRLRQSENPVMRKAAGIFGEEAVGNADGSAVRFSVEENIIHKLKTVEVDYYRVYKPAFRAWVKENRKGAQSLYDPAVRAEFNTLVGKTVKQSAGRSEDPNVLTVVAHVRKFHAEMIQFGKDHNLKGFHSMSPNDLYLTRQHNIQALDDVMGLPGMAGRVHKLFADSLVAGSKRFLNNNPTAAMKMRPLEYEDALTLAKAYLKAIRSRKFDGVNIQQGLSGHDTETLKTMLLDDGVDAVRAQQIVDAVEISRDSHEDGKVSVAKQRVILDEAHRDGDLSIEQFMENDAEVLFKDYANTVIRSGYLEDGLSNFKVPDSEGNMPLYAPSYQTVRGYIAATYKNSTSKDHGSAELRKLDTLYNTVRGIPNDVDSAWNRTLQRLRSYNFVRLMGQLGMAQLPEIGQVLGNGGFKNFVQHAPSFRRLVDYAKTGKFSDKFYMDIEAAWYPGNDPLRYTPSTRLDDGSDVSSLVRGGKSTTMQKVDYSLNQGKHLVSTLSGMTSVNQMLQRFNARVLVNRFLEDAHGDRAIQTRRLRALGIDDAMHSRINAQIVDKMSYTEGILGKKVTGINWEKWDDLDAKNAFINGLDRWARKSIQENSAGAMPAFMTKEMNKTMAQFRSFMIGAYTKQVLAGVHARDIEAFMAFMGSMFFGGLTYVAQEALNSFGRDDRKQHLEDRLSWVNIAKAAFQRAGASTFVPMIFDTGSEVLTGKPVFAYRTTGLSSSIWGNPSVDLATNLTGALSGIAQSTFSSDYDFSRSDFRSIYSLMALQNAFGIRNGLAALSSFLPKNSQ